MTGGSYGGTLPYEDATPQFDDAVKDKVYSFNIDNASIDVKLPIR